MICKVPQVTPILSLRTTASFTLHSTSDTRCGFGTFSRGLCPWLPCLKVLSCSMSLWWRQACHLMATKPAIVRFTEILPGLLHCCLVHKKNYVSAFQTPNFANQCQIQKGSCHLRAVHSVILKVKDLRGN